SGAFTSGDGGNIPANRFTWENVQSLITGTSWGLVRLRRPGSYISLRANQSRGSKEHNPTRGRSEVSQRPRVTQDMNSTVANATAKSHPGRRDIGCSAVARALGGGANTHAR